MNVDKANGQRMHRLISVGVTNDRWMPVVFGSLKKRCSIATKLHSVRRGERRLTEIAGLEHAAKFVSRWQWKHRA